MSSRILSNKSLQLVSLESPYELPFPDNFTDTHLESPALAILTDFRSHPPATLYLDNTVDEARQFFVNAHASVLPVVDRDEHFRGLMPQAGLSDEVVMRLVSFGPDREDLQVRHLMIPRDHLRAIGHDTLAHISVGKLLSLLRQEGQRHVLVVSHDDQQIRGLISAEDLARRLRLTFEMPQQPSFVEIFTALAH